MPLTALDLFCGAGGLTSGLQAAGFRVVGALDNWQPAVGSYRQNFADHPCWLEDIAGLDSERLAALGLKHGVDLVAGGPPCQGFSNQRIGEDEDPRNDLVLAFGRVVVAARPRMFIMENVRGLLGARGKATVEKFVAAMNDAGYDVQHRVLDAAGFGVAQSRRRVFFVGRRIGSSGEFVFPAPSVSRSLTVSEVFAGLGSPPEDSRPMPGDPLHRRTRMSALNRRRIALVPPGGGFEDLPVELRVDCHKAGAARIGHRAVYGRLHPDRPASTITARFDSFTRGRFGHPIEDRNITLREGARLQGFPDTHIFLGTQEEIAAQIGNAIPPPLAAAIGIAAFKALRGIAVTTRSSKSQIELPLFAEYG